MKEEADQQGVLRDPDTPFLFRFCRPVFSDLHIALPAVCRGVEMEIHRIERQVHADAILNPQLQLTAVMGDLYVAAMNRQIELAGPLQDFGSYGFVLNGDWRGCQYLDVAPEPEVVNIDGRKSDDNDDEAGKNG